MTGLEKPRRSNDDLTPSERDKESLNLDAPVTTADKLIDHETPTSEELATLRLVAAPIPWVGLAILAIEVAERASYYGSSGPFNNFINRGLPAGGNGAGAVAPGDAGKNQVPGALGRGSVTASALTQLFTFLAYVMPIFGAIIADTRWGRFKTIVVGTIAGAVAHILLVIPAIPAVISNPNGSLGAFIISLFNLAFAAGFIKPSLSPLLCDQNPVREPRIKVLKSGERVIVDPQVTLQRWLLIFYQCINIGAFFSLATSYSARFVGFWLAFLLPGLVYILMPILLVVVAKRLRKAPPQGSVVVEAFKVLRILLSKGGWKRMWKGGDAFWEQAKPTLIRQRDGGIDSDKVFWDDKFVDEIKQSVRACGVFLLFPFFQLADGGIGNSLNSMSTAMTLNNVPNDLMSKFNPLCIIVFSPILNYGLYPFFTRIGRPIRPMTRMTIGFLLASLGSAIGAIVQWRVYETSPCGYFATTKCPGVSPISLWVQAPIIGLPAIGELFVSVTAYELAYTRSPARMKGLVLAIFLFCYSLSAAIQLALSNAIQDPYLIWPWVAVSSLAFLLSFLFPTYFRELNDPVASFANEGRMAGLEQPK